MNFSNVATRRPAWGLLALCLAATPAPALEPGAVLILVNRDVPISSDVARMYQRARQIPEANVLRLHLGADRYINREKYRAQLSMPVKKFLEEHIGIQCILTTSGVPYVIQTTPGTQDGAAVDNELAAVLREEPKDWNRWQPNPLYQRGQNPFGVKDPRTLQMVFVARLDGPDLKTITRMVEDAVAVDSAGLSGPVFGDSRGLNGATGPAAADYSIRRAIDLLAGAGMPAVLDMNEADWRAPAGGAGDQAAGAAFYVGWYNLQNFQNIFGAQGLARGAIAWHIASGEAVDIWNPKSTEWCINLLRHGAAVTIGPVFEPYLQAFPKAEILVESLLAGRTIAESYWQALPHTSWAMVLLGDPLYRPFGVKPRPALVARAYVGGASSLVVEKGQSSPLLVQLQCVGPAGSGTPPLTAAAEVESGLAGASGMVTIPALQAGQFVMVRVASITASNDAGGLFRLRLDVRNPGETRRIVLEGRTGFSRIAALMDRQTQMFVSPNGKHVISGPVGQTILTETATLQPKAITVPAGWVVASAAFSPDEEHLVLTLLQPEQKRLGFLLVDLAMQRQQSLPEGSQFIRWMANDTILLRSSAGTAKYDIAARTTLPVFAPPGWTVNTVIPGTAIQLLTGAEGRLGVRNGAGPAQEVLAGAKVAREFAVADDLSMFGGRDDQKRLWVQHGLMGKPEVLAEQVEKISWGPISRRVLVQGADGNSRVYDGRTRSWTALPPVLLAQWSPDEERLLYVEAERQGTEFVPRYLSLLDGARSERLCDIGRLGEAATMLLTRSGETAFLLAGPEGGWQVWVTSLPARDRATINPK
ncbi:MAG TPA: TIGR03790 family protein [Candidatus Sulfopaludibacter sp.]|nr:TIGR03790 family protein [Candidatus Sulfopaludibacter sp.]